MTTSPDDGLEDLVARFSRTRTYRPTDGKDEPEELPEGPSGTAVGTAGGDTPESP
ncbi:hypothetical protein [Amycolatopsis kentuckyensis]|uniref:hypothetical protein n=1 Tax=Amycolatopsis kentuckyensis TaxID=218823 RepID=UPI00142E17CE|nr:hypothetical protein [Amycolatopsis kentuckyensis]